MQLGAGPEAGRTTPHSLGQALKLRQEILEKLGLESAEEVVIPRLPKRRSFEHHHTQQRVPPPGPLFAESLDACRPPGKCRRVLFSRLWPS